ncbi:OTU-domain-containing protein [Rhodocollybia butyracea]|uniref:OTU-domain-containing protein n=1 Tax=Rhodocollybia butyracea TaxID=206335 RepID=A0A9P5PPF4_9AGAR|nr:OTU-domain-containing protein [Rhodocollybia butyracea]
MGSRKNKLRKAFSPPFQASPPPESNDDSALLDDLMSQLDSENQTVQGESAQVIQEIQMNREIDNSKKKDSKSRYMARQMRKAAALAESHSPSNPEAEARLAQEAKDEETNIKRICDELNVQIHEINPDGHCLYSAIADQLALLSILPPEQATHATTRLAACNYMYSHPDDFIPFLPSTSGEDGPGALNAGIISPKEFEYYCQAIRDTAEWGGEPEILALSRAFNVPIHVIQSGKPPVVIHNPTGTPNDGDIRDKRVVRISYHRRMYGLGEHYNSLRPQSKISNLSHSIQNMLS